MRSRLAKAWAAITATIRGVVGVEEVAIYTALVLIAWGCWFVWKPAAGIVPGIVMLWLYIPPRKPFIDKPPAVVVRRRTQG